MLKEKATIENMYGMSSMGRKKRKKTKRNADTVVVICERKSWRHDKFRYNNAFSNTENASFHRYYGLKEALVETKKKES